MSEIRTTVYAMLDDGNHVQVPSFRRSDLKQDCVYLFLEEDKLRIFIWVGQNAKPRMKFLGAQGAQALRAERGFSFRTIREEAGEESDEFAMMLDSLGVLPERDPTPIPAVIETSPAIETTPSPSTPFPTSTSAISEPLKQDIPLALSEESKVTFTPPKCPECGKGYLLPYSTPLEGQTHILPIGSWICSHCGLEAIHSRRQ